MRAYHTVLGTDLCCTHILLEGCDDGRPGFIEHLLAGIVTVASCLLRPSARR